MEPEHTVTDQPPPATTSPSQTAAPSNASPSIKSTNPDLNLSPFHCEPPSKYTNATIDSKRLLNHPPTEWLTRTWTVTHSTLDMWRSARNVRITYKPLPSAEGKPEKIDDLVEYEPTKSSTPKLKNVKGVDTRSEIHGYDWRGKSWLFFVTSHWEILGWGEVLSADGNEVVERWAVTWFAPTVFTKEGVDFYSDREGGMSEETYKKIYEGLEGMVLGDADQSDSKPLGLKSSMDVVRMWREDLLPVEIKLPWVKG